MENISKAFPGVQALSNVDLDLAPGEVLALVGENGAGKSTLMKILSGAYRKDAGRILVNGREVEIRSPYHAQQMGIAIIYQEFNLAPNQSAAANIFIAREPRRSGLGRLFVDRGRMEREAQKYLDMVGAHVAARTLVRDLPVAEQQMVEIAKALAVDARIIIMDEPTSALGEDEVETLFEIIRTLKERGLGVIFITHRLDEVFRIADRVVVLRDGMRVGCMPINEATPDKLIQLMVGREVKDLFHKEEAEIGAPLLEVRGLTRQGVVENVSFTLRRGEILGFAGLVGAGRTETARLLFGADPKDAGEIYIEGKRIQIESPIDALKAGIGFVPEDRSKQGLVLRSSVLENIALPTLDRHTRLGAWLDHPSLRKTAQQYVDKLNIRTPSLEQKALFLSGGNQQKTVVAKWLASQPRVLIMDEPTRGIDVGAKAEVHALISQLAQAGLGIIMISSELPEILGMSDRILVMSEGRVAAILDRAEATQETIMAYASGERVDNNAADSATSRTQR
ncbi:MAG: sugar ABC transporter ATP-binding protein [Anaerolineae bacterium]|nr:sugar ABC transporter ATP-binding protein [Anaerolineae bacterium]MDH7475719.1 sugar ABC transporter ATP-binding protein [Anaerolineae bacterium]